MPGRKAVLPYIFAEWVSQNAWLFFIKLNRSGYSIACIIKCSDTYTYGQVDLILEEDFA